MTELREETVKHLAKLCRIQLGEDEVAHLSQDLSRILDYVEQLDELDTEGVRPCDHVIEEIVNVFREDEVGETLDREIFLNNAPEHKDGLICVPPVIKKN